MSIFNQGTHIHERHYILTYLINPLSHFLLKKKKKKKALYKQLTHSVQTQSFITVSSLPFHSPDTATHLKKHWLRSYPFCYTSQLSNHSLVVESSNGDKSTHKFCAHFESMQINHRLNKTGNQMRHGPRHCAWTHLKKTAAGNLNRPGQTTGCDMLSQCFKRNGNNCCKNLTFAWQNCSHFTNTDNAMNNSTNTVINRQCHWRSKNLYFPHLYNQHKLIFLILLPSTQTPASYVTTIRTNVSLVPSHYHYRDEKDTYLVSLSK